jgi:biopolymer transport protein ExbB/biopolymer transport protein TolQ
MIMKFRELRAAERDTEDFVEAYLESSLENAYEVARKHPSSPLATVFRAGYTELARLEKIQGGSGRVTRDQVEGVISRLGWIRGEEVHRFERGLSFLATIASSGPFVGLFGTVIGIINAFRGMAMTGSGGIAAVSAGISEALVTTALGLFVAIPAAWVYNAFTNMLDRFGVEMSNSASELIDFFIKKHGGSDAVR